MIDADQFPVQLQKIPCSSGIIPCSQIDECRTKAPQNGAYFHSMGDLGGRESSKFPVIFPVSREFAVENGSLRTASTAIQSANRGARSKTLRPVSRMPSRYTNPH
jgi:hypothetical protein